MLCREVLRQSCYCLLLTCVWGKLGGLSSAKCFA